MKTTQFAECRADASQVATDEAWAPVDRNGDWNGERIPITQVGSQAGRLWGAATIPRADVAAALPARSSMSIRRRTQLILRFERGQGPTTTRQDSTNPRGFKVLIHCVIRDCQGTTWLLVVEDDQPGRDTLAAAGLIYRAESVLLLEVAPWVGEATRLSQRLAAAQIDVLYSYAGPVADDRLTAVFKTADDARAMDVLQAESGEAGTQYDRADFLPKRAQLSFVLPELRRSRMAWSETAARPPLAAVTNDWLT